MDATPELMAAGTESRRGRPTLPPDERRQHTAARFRKEIKEKLEAAAAAAGRSMSQEIELRIEESFRAEKMGGRDLHRLQLLIGFAITSIEVETGKGFATDWLTFRKVMAAIETIIKSMRPDMSAELKAWFEDLGEDPGTFPAEPEKPRGSGHLMGQQLNVSPEEQAAYEKAMDEYRGDCRVWALKRHAREKHLNERVNFDRETAEAGRAIAALLLPKRKRED